MSPKKKQVVLSCIAIFLLFTAFFCYFIPLRYLIYFKKDLIDVAILCNEDKTISTPKAKRLLEDRFTRYNALFPKNWTT